MEEVIWCQEKCFAAASMSGTRTMRARLSYDEVRRRGLRYQRDDGPNDPRPRAFISPGMAFSSIFFDKGLWCIFFLFSNCAPRHDAIVHLLRKR